MKINELSDDDPRVASVKENLAQYVDHIRNMSEEDRRRFRNKVLAVLTETGQIIAAENSIEELRRAVRKSEYNGRDWRAVDGPTDGERLSLEQAAS